MTSVEKSKCIAIAKKLGWKRRIKKGLNGWWNDPQGFSYSSVPNYTGDLNACYRMEQSLSEEDHYYYSNLLCELANPDCMEMAYVANPEAGMYPGLVSATAEQRTGAFIAYLKLRLK